MLKNTCTYIYIYKKNTNEEHTLYYIKHKRECNKFNNFTFLKLKTCFAKLINIYRVKLAIFVHTKNKVYINFKTKIPRTQLISIMFGLDNIYILD